MDIRLSEIVAALSHALDVTEGQPMGHAERSCLIGLRLADATDLDPERRSSLFYALLLKDAGCSTTSATTAEVFGSDELHVKREGRLVDPKRPAQSLRYLSRTIAPGAPLRTRARHLRALVAMGVDGARQLGAMRCERGADVARSIDLDEDAARAIHELDEHWDGHGYPASLAGEAISPLARIICLAQAMEVFWQQGGARAACAVARERRGTWFDPALVDAVAGFEHDAAFWASLHEPDVNALEPADRVQRADDARLDRIAEAFATIVDAKSPYTASHSAGVADIAEAIAATMGVDTGTHHECLDGSGYPDRLTAAELDLPDRILQVADVAEALSAERPYRAALPVDEVLSIMGRDAGPKLDAGAVAALEAWLPGRDGTLAAAA